MALIDNTTYIYILKQLSNKSEEAICADLLLADSELKNRMRKGYDKGRFPDGSKKFTVYWPSTEKWRKVSNYHKEFESLDNRDLTDQAFPELGHKNEYSFTSHAYDTLIDYINCFSTNSGKNALLDAKELISRCFDELSIPSEYSHIIKGKDSIEDIARYIVSFASTEAKKLNDKQTQASKPQALRKKE